MPSASEGHLHGKTILWEDEIDEDKSEDQALGLVTTGVVLVWLSLNKLDTMLVPFGLAWLIE